jgi:glucokinase
MLKKSDHVSFEHVCSGIGIPNIYGYLRDVEGLKEEPQVAAAIAAASDPTAAIVNHALESSNPGELCWETVATFVLILAGEAGNLAVKFLATGGVYIAGGVAVHTLKAIETPAFMERFKRKGRFAELLARIPIHVVVAPAGLAGAAACGLEKPSAGPAIA